MCCPGFPSGRNCPRIVAAYMRALESWSLAFPSFPCQPILRSAPKKDSPFSSFGVPVYIGVHVIFWSPTQPAHIIFPLFDQCLCITMGPCTTFIVLIQGSRCITLHSEQLGRTSSNARYECIWGQNHDNQWNINTYN